MGKNLSMVLFAMVFATAMVNHCAVAQTVHVVGDSFGWGVPTNDDFYDDWSDNKVFRVGDILTFNFVTGSHNVVEVTEALYDACTATTTIGNVTVTGPANVTLTSVGDHYYICTVGNHCLQGQKLDITVTVAAATPPPPPAATPPPPPVATPPPSSATPSPPPVATPPPSSATPSPSPAATPPPSATPRPMTPPPMADAPTSPPPSMNGPASPTTPTPTTPESSSTVVLASVMGTVMSVAVCLFF